MKAVNPFDNKIEAQKRMPAEIRDAAIELTDTLDLCWAAAQAVFEKQAKPEHAIALLPMFMDRSDAKRQQEEDEIRGHTGGAPARPSTKRRPRPGPMGA